MAIWESATATATVTGSVSGNFTAIGSPKVGTGTLAAYSGQMFWVIAAGGAETLKLVTTSAVNFSAVETTEYSFTGSISAVDGTPQYANVTSIASVATISGLTTSLANDLVWAACIGTDGVCSAGAGYTGRDDASAWQWTGTCVAASPFSTITGARIEDKVNVAAGAQTATFGTTGATDNNILGLVAF